MIERIRQGLVAGIAFLALASPATAQQPPAEDELTLEARQQHITAQIDDMADLLGREAMFPWLQLFTGRLPQGGSERITLSLDQDREWEIVGVCDRACPNLDLALYGRDDEMLVEDRLPDDIPLLAVTTRAPGSFQLEIIMTECESDFCMWGVRPFSRRSGGMLPDRLADPRRSAGRIP